MQLAKENMLILSFKTLIIKPKRINMNNTNQQSTTNIRLIPRVSEAVNHWEQEVAGAAPNATITKPPTRCYAIHPPSPMVVSITQPHTPPSRNQTKNKNHSDENSIVASKLLIQL